MSAKPRMALPWLAAVATLAYAGAAQAARPLVTEDSDALAQGDCEWESGAARETRSGSDAVRGWATQLGCGVGASTQLALAYGRSGEGEEKSQSVTLSGKTQLKTRQDAEPGLALAYCLLRVRAAGEAFRTESTLVNLVASRSMGETLTLHANLGWLRDRVAGLNTTTWALGAEAPVGSGIDLAAEVYGDDRIRPWVNGGVRWGVSEKFSLNASYGVQWDTPRVKLLTLGAKLAF